MSTQITLTNFMKGRVKVSTVLDHIEQKLLEQGCKSMNISGNCSYRGDNNTKCGIGHIIPDSVYTKGMDDPRQEDNSVGGILERYGNRFKLDRFDLMDNDKLSLLADIQDIHDNISGDDYKFTAKIKLGFKRLREEYVND